MSYDDDGYTGLSAKLCLPSPEFSGRALVEAQADLRKLAGGFIGRDRARVVAGVAQWLERLANDHEARGAYEHAQFTRADAAMLRQELLSEGEHDG